MSGLILGRSPVLWYGFLVALANLLEIVGVIHLESDAIAALDGVLAVGLALLANSSDPRTVPTFALSVTPPALTTTIATSSSGPIPAQAGSSGTTGSLPSDPSAGTGSASATDPSAGGVVDQAAGSSGTPPPA